LLDSKTASDHFPKVADISFNTITGVQYENNVFRFGLEQNYPNPFNPTTTISWQIAEDGQVSIKVYDVLGNELATLINEYLSAGDYQFEFDGNGLSSGIYFYILRTENYFESKKMILMK